MLLVTSLLSFLFVVYLQVSSSKDNTVSIQLDTKLFEEAYEFYREEYCKNKTEFFYDFISPIVRGKIVYRRKSFENSGNKRVKTPNSITKIRPIVDADLETISLQIFTNPVKRFLHFEISNVRNENTTIQLMNILGKIVLTKNIESISSIRTINTKIDIKEFRKGIYILQIINGEMKIAKKIMIK